MKKILIFSLLILGIMLSFQFQTLEEHNNESNNTSAEEGVILLELFTSQGCSSCPSADKLLNKTLSENKNVIGLSYHVDYWNYIGWNDPFSTKEYSNYQRAYASKFNSASIYTPQLVVNGRSHFTGSDKSKVHNRTQERDSYLPKSIAISNLKRANANIDFTVTSETKVDLITVVLVIEHRETEILRGENRNRILSNSNIVVARDVMYNTNGGAMSIPIPKLVNVSDHLKLIAFSQDNDLKVLSAVQAKL